MQAASFGSGGYAGIMRNSNSASNENQDPIVRQSLTELTSLLNPVVPGISKPFMVAVSLDQQQQLRLYNQARRKNWAEFSPPAAHPVLTSAMIARIIEEAAAPTNKRVGCMRYDSRGKTGADVVQAATEGSGAADDSTRDQKRWDELTIPSKCRRLLSCVKDFAASLERWRGVLNIVEPDGQQSPPDRVLRHVLQHAISDAHTENRVQLTADFVPPVLRGEIEDDGKERDRAQQQEKYHTAKMEQWMVLKGMLSAVHYRALTNLVPSHLRPTIQRLAFFTEGFHEKHHALLTIKRTFSGCQLQIVPALRLILTQLFITYVSGFENGWKGDIRIVMKIMVDGFNLPNLSSGGMIAAHGNSIFLSGTPGERVTDVFRGHEDQMQARNPAGKLTPATSTFALFLGAENFHNLSTNLAGIGEGPSRSFDPDVLGPQIGTASKTLLETICGVYNIDKAGAQGRVLCVEDLRAAVRQHFDQHKDLYNAGFFARSQVYTADGGSKFDKMQRATEEESLYPVMAKLQGVAYVARIPVGTRDVTGRLEISYDAAGKPMYTEQRGTFGSLNCPDLKGTWMACRWGHGKCKVDCRSAAFRKDPLGLNTAPISGYQCHHGNGCVFCNVSSCNEYNPLSNLTLTQILDHMAWPEHQPLFLKDVCDFYRILESQLVRWPQLHSHHQKG